MERSVREQLADALYENRALRGVLAGHSATRWDGIRLGRRPTLMLGLLSTGRTYTREEFLDALQLRFPREMERYPSAVAVNISRIRSALRGADPLLTVSSASGVGYWMPASSRTLLAARVK